MLALNLSEIATYKDSVHLLGWCSGGIHCSNCLVVFMSFALLSGEWGIHRDFSGQIQTFRCAAFDNVSIYLLTCSSPRFCHWLSWLCLTNGLMPWTKWPWSFHSHKERREASCETSSSLEHMMKYKSGQHVRLKVLPQTSLFPERFSTLTRFC